jgi:alpha/beta superfamily hydrolase
VEVIEGRAVRIESEGPSLEGLLHVPEGASPFPGIVICHPHPQMGGEMHNNVVGALVRAALGEGIAALRFNFRGVGASEGSYDGGKGEQDDARAALHYLRSQPEINAERIAIAGYSFGSIVAVRVAYRQDDLAAVVAVSNPVERGGAIEVLLKPPTLFITGDRDEYVDHNLLLEYEDQIGDDVTVEVLEGVDHFWWGSDGRLIELVGAFMRKHLK